MRYCLCLLVFCSDLILNTVAHSARVHCLRKRQTVFVSILTFSLSLLQMADPGQFPLPSFAGHHVIHSVQLFRKCWISTMAFTVALLAFVWSNLGWMWWLGVQGGLTAEWESSCLSLSSGLWAAQLEGLMGFSAPPTRSLQAEDAERGMKRDEWRWWVSFWKLLLGDWSAEAAIRGEEGKAGRTVCSSVPYTWTAFTGITD